MNIISKFLQSIYISKITFYVFIILIILSFSITFYLLLPDNQLIKDPSNLQYWLLADVIFVLILTSLIIRQILMIIIYRRKNLHESKLYIKFINLFTAMALGPTIGVVVITSLFFNLELRTLYGGAFRGIVENSNLVAKDYQDQIQAELISDTQLIMREILKLTKNNEVQKNEIEIALIEFINLRTISNVYLFNKKGEVFISSEDKKILNFTLPDTDIFSLLDKNQVYIFERGDSFLSAYKKINL